MSDLIRREDAIDALKKYEELESNNFTDTSPISMMTVATIANCIEEIVNLPSAEPERKWIPVSEALPEDRQKVLCVNKHGEMMVGGYMTDYGMTFPCYFEKPIAWMPLPEPWRGE